MGWVTINGVHVLIQDGRVIKGPSSMLNKHIKFLGKDDNGRNLYDAVDSWAHHAGSIRRASRGETRLIEKIYEGENIDNAKKLEQYIKEGEGVSDTIFRGLNNLDKKDFSKLTTVGETVDQRGLSSWTTDKDAAISFRGFDKDKGVILVQKGSKLGRKLNEVYDRNSSEAEVIVSSNAKQTITKIEKDTKGYSLVFVEEISKIQGGK